MKCRHAVLLLLVVLFTHPDPVSAQSLFGGIGSALENINGVNMYIAPSGWLWGDGLTASNRGSSARLDHDDLFEVGFEVSMKFDNPLNSVSSWTEFKADGCRYDYFQLNVGMDYLTGFSATDPSLDLALPFGRCPRSRDTSGRNGRNGPRPANSRWTQALP